MNQQLDAVFKEQQDRLSHQDESTHNTEQQSFLLFSVGISQFIIPIEEIKEVTEFIPLRPYPLPVPKHLGVVNIRGEVVPVISMAPFLSTDFDETKFILSHQASRLIVLTGSDHEHFSILASSAKKINCAMDSNLANQTAVTINGAPIRLLSIPEIIEKSGSAA